MAILREIRYYRDASKIYGYEHWCPGCREIHVIPVNHSHPKANWTFNGSFTRPTFNPSVRLMRQQGVTYCHYFIRDGMIDFCADSPHELKGQKVPLPELPDE